MPPSRFLPPPRRRVRPVKADNKEEEIKDMDGTRTYYLKKCKTKSWSLAESIPVPDELLFEILLRLPAQDIYYASRLVCQKWYHMMRTKNFIHEHLEHASYGLLFLDKFENAVFISSGEVGGGINTYKLNYIYRRTVWASCNGLMLEYNRFCSRRISYYVVNVSTDQAFRLPVFTFRNVFTQASGIGYDAASMTYKVVVTYRDQGFGYHCAILTVGVDKSWREVRIDHLSEHVKRVIHMRPIVTEGFLHWNHFGDTKVLTLNLETEIIADTHPPVPEAILPEEKSRCFCMSTGRYLSFFRRCEELALEVFVMKPETGEWRKLPNICLEGQKRRIIERLGFTFKHEDIDIKPYGWLKYPEVLALRIRCVIIFYNLITCEIGVEKLFNSRNVLLMTPHKNSLVWLGGP